MNVFELWAAISLDTSDYENQLNNAGQKTDSFSEKLQSGLATAAKVATAAITAATTAVTALTKSAIENYADYEQLVGGVETLFKDSADTILEYANNAYKTAGLSANDYMETVTSFSASLLQSLDNDTAAAAEKADLAITDMSDNANKMGTTMESIQNAYQGFAKQNYTMLDNLKLGYGGTKEEMERLLEDATALSGIEYDISSYADIVDAIHVIQTEMGITGTTALEASTTISGSISSMKSAWTNFVTGLGNSNADISELFDELVESVETVGSNVLPVVQTILANIGQTVTEKLPEIIGMIPEVLESVVPQMLTAGVALLSGIIDGFGQAMPQLVDTAVMLMENFAAYLTDNLPLMIETGMNALMSFSGSLRENVGTLVDAALEMIVALADGLIASLPTLIETVPTIVTNIAGIINDNAPKLISTGLELIEKLIIGIIQAIPTIIANMPQIIEAIVSVITAYNWIGLGKNIINALVSGIKALVSAIPTAIKSILTNTGSIIQNFGWGTLGRAIITLIQNGISALASAIPNALQNIGTTAMNYFKNINWVSVGSAIVNGILSGITSGWSWLTDTVANLASNLLNAAKSALGIHSPSKLFRSEVGQMIGEGLALGIDDSTEDAVDSMGNMIDSIADASESIPDTVIGDYVVSANNETGTSDVSSANSYLETLVSLLSTYLPQIENMQIVLDSGSLVGGISTQMDSALGKLAIAKAR